MRNSYFSATRLTLLLAGVATAACAVESGVEQTGTAQQRIIYGQASTDVQDAVVMMIHLSQQDGGGTGIGSCSGTLIAPNLVLTARHCVSQVTAQAFACDEDGNEFPRGTAGAIAGADLPADGFYVYTGKKSPFGSGLPHKPNGIGKKLFHDGAKILCSHDLALVLLQADIPGALIAKLRIESDPVVGEKMTAVGWGLTEDGQRPTARLQRKGIVIEQVGPFASDGVSGPVPPNDFAVGECICSGDSGGPGFSEETGAVMGVVSRGGNGSRSTAPGAACVGEKTRNNYTKVAPFKALIEKAFEASGHDPWYEGRPDPRLGKGSDVCAENAECQSNLCEKALCLEACGVDDACAEGTKCVADDEGGKACKAPAPTGGGGSSSSGCAASSSSRSPFGALGVVMALAALFSRRRTRR